MCINNFHVFASVWNIGFSHVATWSFHRSPSPEPIYRLKSLMWQLDVFIGLLHQSRSIDWNPHVATWYFHRSPSPEPIYSNEGKRLNTREYRTRKKLEEERHALIQHVMKDNPDYKPPIDYRYYYVSNSSHFTFVAMRGVLSSFWLFLLRSVYICFILVVDRPPLIRVSDKVLIPQDEHPELNFVGMLIGPRGNTQKNLEKEVSSI